MQGLNDRDKETGSVSVSIERNKEQFQEQREKFKKEAQRIRKLNNPHIIKVHDLFEENGTTYYVMDFIDGESLSERLKRTGIPLTEHEVQKILPQILNALKTVHGAGIWHLDLKPANIMIDKAGSVSLIDFGASKQLNAQKGGATTSTAISYTNGYAPREQMEQNYDKFGPWTDIYALGATLYTLLTNKRPPLPTDIDDDITEDKHIALPFSDEVSDEIKQKILWMLRTNRNQRPQNINELLTIREEVKEEIDEETIIASKPKESKVIKEEKQNVSPSGFQKYNVIQWTIIGVVLMAIIAGLVFFNGINLGESEPKVSEEQKDAITEAIDSKSMVTEIGNFETSLGYCRYKGPVDRFNLPNGDGEAFFTDGRYYKGPFISGILNGKGAYFKYPNGDVFMGEFRKNSFYEGTYTIAEDGSYFRGTFINGQPDKGVWYDKNGKTIQ